MAKLRINPSVNSRHPHFINPFDCEFEKGVHLTFEVTASQKEWVRSLTPYVQEMLAAMIMSGVKASTGSTKPEVSKTNIAEDRNPAPPIPGPGF